MFERILKVMREKIRTREYIMTLHAEEEMNNDDFSVFDVEHCILTGKISERQRDRATSELKYRVRGKTVCGDRIEIIAKFGASGKLVIITVFQP